ncbi:unnamed protein product [Rotaria socialis]|uniref:Integrase catalytic domain-containing protein n=1 Tax=Rotaria socialis TaxID=392032 RepID=A0A821MWU4_9BILA|nr:unnamed protein product [Rotaria socialis]
MAMVYYYKLLDNHIQSLNSKFREKFSIKQSLYDDIILVLRDGWGDSQLKFWVHKNFKLAKNGDQHLVYEIKSNCPIVTYENLFIKIKECHEKVGHQGRDKTWLQVKAKYSRIPIDSIKLYIALCDVCCKRKGFPKPTVEKPIVSMGYLTRLQMDLLDMRNIQDGEYKWILYTMDHFTKFSWAYSLKSKEVKSIADKLLEQFYSFGTPRILQSDNGKKFVAKVIKVWHKSCIRLTPVQQSIKITPYEEMFGPKSRYDNDVWQVLSAQDVVNEEDLPQNVIDKLKEYENQTSAMEVTTTFNINNSLASAGLVRQTSFDLTLPTALPPKFHMSPQMKNRKRSELPVSEQIKPIDTEKEFNSSKAYSMCKNQRLRSETEVMDMTITFKRRKLFHDTLHQY